MLGGGAAGAVGPARGSSEPANGQRAEVSIIIPCRNEASWIRRSLEGLPAQTIAAASMEVIVSDGMLTDGTRRMAEIPSGDGGSISRSDRLSGADDVSVTHPACEPVSALIAQTRRGARELVKWRRRRVSAWAGRGGVWLASASPSTRSCVRTPPLIARSA